MTGASHAPGERDAAAELRRSDDRQAELFDAPAPEAGPPLVDDSLHFRHPAASRTIRLGEHEIGYALTRAPRRSIGFIVQPCGLSVRAPKRASQTHIDDALHAKARWIVAKLVEQRERNRQRRERRIEWRDGATIPFLGSALVVRLGPAGAADSLRQAPHCLRLDLPVDADPTRIRIAALAWLRQEAMPIFEARCRIYAERLGVDVKRLALSSAKTRWGSASADGSIRLNWRLVHFDLATIDYVVAHELAHLEQMNHGPRFWALVRSVIPDMQSARRTLRHADLPELD